MSILTHHRVRGISGKYKGVTIHTVHDWDGSIHGFYTAFLESKQTSRGEKGGADNTLASDFLGLKMLESLIVLFEYEYFHQRCAYGEGITDKQVNFLNQYLDLEPKKVIALAEKKLSLEATDSAGASATIGDPVAVIRAELDRIPEATHMTRRVRKKTVREYLDWLHQHGNRVLLNHYDVPMDLRTTRNERTSQYKKISIPKILSNQTTTATVDEGALEAMRSYLKEGITHKEAQQIWQGEDIALRNLCMIYTQYYSGVRMGELLALKWDKNYLTSHSAEMNCDFNRPGPSAVGSDNPTTEGRIIVRQRLAANRADDPRAVEKMPMPKTRERVISVTEKHYWQLFDLYNRAYNRVRIDYFDGKLEHPYYFIGMRYGRFLGSALSVPAYENVFARLKKHLGIHTKQLGSHSLRAMACKNFVDDARAAGQSEEAIRTGMLRRFGWSPYSKMPTHYTERDTKDFVDNINKELIDDDDTSLIE